VVGRPLLTGLVRAVTVGMAGVLSEDHSQVPFVGAGASLGWLMLAIVSEVGDLLR
jgi:hypothetical protein